MLAGFAFDAGAGGEHAEPGAVPGDHHIGLIDVALFGNREAVGDVARVRRVWTGGAGP